MPKYEIYYANSTVAGRISIPKTLDDLHDTHRQVMECEAEDLQDLVKKSFRTSMSVGDIAHDPLTDKWWICDLSGFKELPFFPMPPIIKLKKMKWEELQKDDLVYIRGQAGDKPCVYGPHRVHDPEKRELSNVIRNRFKHYPDDLYKEVYDGG